MKWILLQYFSLATWSYDVFLSWSVRVFCFIRRQKLNLISSFIIFLPISIKLSAKHLLRQIFAKHPVLRANKQSFIQLYTFIFGSLSTLRPTYAIHILQYTNSRSVTTIIHKLCFTCKKNLWIRLLLDVFKTIIKDFQQAFKFHFWLSIRKTFQKTFSYSDWN